MFKSTKIFFSSIFIVIFVCILGGIIFRNSITDIEYSYVERNAEEYMFTDMNPVKEKRDIMLIINDMSEDNYTEDLNNIGKHMEEISTHIVKVKFNGNRRIVKGAILNEVDVEERYKGECPDKIYVYENMSIMNPVEGVGSITTNKGYLPMIKGKEYLLYLKKQDFMKDYKFMDNQDSSYFITNEFLGKYPLDDSKDNYLVRKLEYGENIHYSEVVGKERFFDSTELLNYYLEERENAIKKYIH